MKDQRNNHIKSWVESNLWNLILTAVGIIIASVTLQSRVTTIEASQKTLETKISKYPSEDWFTLKFKTIEDAQAEIKKEIQTIKKGSDLRE